MWGKLPFPTFRPWKFLFAFNTQLRLQLIMEAFSAPLQTQGWAKMLRAPLHPTHVPQTLLSLSIYLATHPSPPHPTQNPKPRTELA